MTPFAPAQHRPLALVISQGPNGWRVAFAGGPTFDVIADGLTEAQARAAQAAGWAVADRLRAGRPHAADRRAA